MNKGTRITLRFFSLGLVLGALSPAWGMPAGKAPASTSARVTKKAAPSDTMTRLAARANLTKTRVQRTPNKPAHKPPRSQEAAAAHAQKTVQGTKEGHQPRWGRAWTRMPIKRLLAYTEHLLQQGLAKQCKGFLRNIVALRYHPRLAFTLGLCAQKDRDWRQSMAAFWMLHHFERAPKWRSWALYGLGTAQLGRYRRTSAHYSFSQVISLYKDQPAAAGALFELGKMERRQARWQEAMAYFRRAGTYKKNPFAAQSLKQLADIYLHKKRDYFHAIKTYLTLAKRFHTHAADAYYAIARIYDRLEDTKHALQYYRAMRKAAPYHMHTARVKARIQKLSGM